MANSNVLSSRYATSRINDIFSAKGKQVAQRELWIAVMKAQKELGLDIPGEDIARFESAKEDVNLELIRDIEKRTKHDVKAGIEAYVIVSGAGEHLHKGMTSRDLTDNVEQMQIRDASRILFGKYVSLARHFADKAEAYRDIFLTSRTHNQPAQLTSLGRRFSMWGEELLGGILGFEGFIESYALRGIKGPVGTQTDMLTLLGSQDRVEQLEKSVMQHLGFRRTLDSPGQVYPRSLDFELASQLAIMSAAPENFAKTLRIMAGYELATEGFREGQVGSSAMPHKMNTPHSERITGLANLIKMYADGASRISGDQWQEGDVSDSVVRRVVIPDAFYASDGLVETTLNVLNGMGVYPAMIEAEVDRYLPFLATTEVLMEAVKAGMGREQAHGVIKKHAVATALDMRKGGKNNLVDRLMAEPEFTSKGIDKSIRDVLSNREGFIGNAYAQIDAVVKRTDELVSRYKEAASYEPQPIL